MEHPTLFWIDDLGTVYGSLDDPDYEAIMIRVTPSVAMRGTSVGYGDERTIRIQKGMEAAWVREGGERLEVLWDEVQKIVRGSPMQVWFTTWAFKKPGEPGDVYLGVPMKLPTFTRKKLAKRWFGHYPILDALAEHGIEAELIPVPYPLSASRPSYALLLITPVESGRHAWEIMLQVQDAVLAHGLRRK